MQWQRSVLGLHIACVLLAFSLVVWAWLYLPRTTALGPAQYAAARAVCLFAASAALTGLFLMAGRSGKAESLALAVSTIAAFVLLVLAW